MIINMCLSGFCTGLFAGCAGALLNYIILSLFKLMQG